MPAWLLLQAAPQGGALTMLLPMVLMFAIFWLIVWRPQSQEQQRLDKLRQGLKVGDEVFTVSGLVGKVAEVEASIVWLEVAPKTKIRVLRDRVQGLLSEALATSEAKDSKTEDAKGVGDAA